MAPTVRQLTSTRTFLARGIWADAGLTMAGSALTGYRTLGNLQEMAAIGLIISAAVDVLLIVVLKGDQSLQACGIDTGWRGRMVRIGTAAMSGLLNCGYSMATGQYFLALIHACLPILLVAGTEYHQHVSILLHRAIEAAQAADDAANAPVVVESTREPAPNPIGGLSPDFRGVSGGVGSIADIGGGQDLQRSLGSAPEVPTVTPLPFRPHVVQPTGSLRTAQRIENARRSSSTPPGRRSPVKAKAIKWLTAQHALGTDLATITPADLASGARLKLDTCRRSLDEWRAVVLQEVAS